MGVKRGRESKRERAMCMCVCVCINIYTYICSPLFSLKCFSSCASFEMFSKMRFVQTSSEMLLWFTSDFSFTFQFNLFLHVIAYF